MPVAKIHVLEGRYDARLAQRAHISDKEQVAS
jgi:hypothetical protein